MTASMIRLPIRVLVVIKDELTDYTTDHHQSYSPDEFNSIFTADEIAELNAGREIKRTSTAPGTPSTAYCTCRLL